MISASAVPTTYAELLIIEHLQADGYSVTAPAFSLTRLADDVARLRQVLVRQNGPTLVAGHSYGGQIITALGTDTPNVGPAWSTSPRLGWMRVSRSAPCWRRDRQVPPGASRRRPAKLRLDSRGRLRQPLRG